MQWLNEEGHQSIQVALGSVKVLVEDLSGVLEDLRDAVAQLVDDPESE